MIVTQDVAASAYTPVMTEEQVERAWEAWNALPESDVLKRVEDLVHGLSQDVFWAGLLNNIDTVLWRLVNLSPQDLKNEDSGAITVKQMQAQVVELRSLTVEAVEPWWFAYDLDGTPFGYSVARQVPLETWVARLPNRAQRGPFVIWSDR